MEVEATLEAIIQFAQSESVFSPDDIAKARDELAELRAYKSRHISACKEWNAIQPKYERLRKRVAELEAAIGNAVIILQSLDGDHYEAIRAADEYLVDVYQPGDSKSETSNDN